MRKATPPLNALRAFEAAARHQSFTRAAEELCVTPGAISQQIAGLEARLGFLLFKRVKQRLLITQAGSSYLIPLKDSLDRIEAATLDLLQHGGAGGNLHVGALPSLASLWLIPRLGDFAKQHPNIKLNLTSLNVNFTSTHRSPDLEAQNIDIGLFYGDGHWDGLNADILLPETLIPVVSPNLIKGVATNPDIFKTTPLLQHSTRPNSWQEWFVHNDMPSQTPQGFRFEHFHMVIEAAIAGLGIAMVPRLFAQIALTNGQLIELEGNAVTSRRAYYLVYDPAKAEDPTIGKFKTWILDAIHA